MSILEEAIDALCNNHDLMPGVDTNKKRHQVEGRCHLSSGIEYSFVNLFCQRIFRRIPNPDLLGYHQFFFIPNLKAEAKVGYDLSIGSFYQNSRVRTMHKVINEKYCDQQWTYRFNFSRNKSGEFSKDYGHFIKLLFNNQGDLEHPGVEISPYLVINVCYCIHDYRRMGTLFEQDQLTVPSFHSLLRTIIIDLKALQKQLERFDIDVLSEQFYFRLSRHPEKRQPTETPPEYIDRITNKNNLRLECSGQIIETQNVFLSFDEFFQKIDWNTLINIMPNERE